MIKFISVACTAIYLGKIEGSAGGGGLHKAKGDIYFVKGV